MVALGYSITALSRRHCGDLKNGLDSQAFTAVLRTLFSLFGCLDHSFGPTSLVEFYSNPSLAYRLASLDYSEFFSSSTITDVLLSKRDR